MYVMIIMVSSMTSTEQIVHYLTVMEIPWMLKVTELTVLVL